MSLYQCEKCGCCENTALGATGHGGSYSFYDWSDMPELKGKKLCSVCGPKKYSDGTPTEYGVWHDQFDRTFLPIGEFKTNQRGNLEHIKTGSENFRKFAITPSEPGTEGE